MNSSSPIDVAVVGAGPYGLSIAAHLRVGGLRFRIFGSPMSRWRYEMPKGMFLRSDGCASNLSDPSGGHTLERFCGERGLPYGAKGVPISLELFMSYALWFQQQLVPSVEEVMVTRIEQLPGGFELSLANGEQVMASRVVVATGLEHSTYVPPELTALPATLLSHSSQQRDLSTFAGKEVLVIGGGQAALETSALLSEQGASVQVLVRSSALRWNSSPEQGSRSLYRRLRSPDSNLGAGWKLWFHSNAPGLFRYFPQSVRLEKLRTILGPAGAWWLKNRVLGQVRVCIGHHVTQSAVRDGRAVVQVETRDGRQFELTADHVIAATGYRFSLQRLPFIGDSLRSGLRSEHGRPLLSNNFQSSIPGLYFTGFASINSFGPAMRFIHGAAYTARRVCRHIAFGPQHLNTSIPVLMSPGGSPGTLKTN